jgi:hypothetical protein
MFHLHDPLDQLRETAPWETWHPSNNLGKPALMKTIIHIEHFYAPLNGCMSRSSRRPMPSVRGVLSDFGAPVCGLLPDIRHRPSPRSHDLPGRHGASLDTPSRTRPARPYPCDRPPLANTSLWHRPSTCEKPPDIQPRKARYPLAMTAPILGTTAGRVTPRASQAALRRVARWAGRSGARAAGDRRAHGRHI